MEAVVLHRVRFLDYFCPKQGQDFKPSAAPVYPNMGRVHPPGLAVLLYFLLTVSRIDCQQDDDSTGSDTVDSIVNIYDESPAVLL